MGERFIWGVIMKIQVKYTIKTTYEFDEAELVRDYPEEDNLMEFAQEWIEEDFERITNRADNVLPFDYKVNIQFVEKEINRE